MRIKVFFYGIFVFLIAITNTVLLAQSKGGRWQFEQNGDDTADWDNSDNPGFLQNQAVFDSVSPLAQGGYYLLTENSGSNDFFKIADDNDLDFNNENIAISAWIFPTSLNDVHFILNKGFQDSNPKTTNYAIRIASNKKLEFLIRDANNKAQKVASGFTIPENKWTFIAVFYDYSAHKVYIWNAVTTKAADTLDFQQDFFPNDAPLAIGGWAKTDPADQLAKGFKGRIDDVRISGRIEDVLPHPTSLESTSGMDHYPKDFDFRIYPNPADRSQDQFSIYLENHLKTNDRIEIRIYNILGQEIHSYTSSAGESQEFVFRWNLRDNYGNLLSCGPYFVKVRVSKRIFVKKFIIVK